MINYIKYKIKKKKISIKMMKKIFLIGILFFNNIYCLEEEITLDSCVDECITDSACNKENENDNCLNAINNFTEKIDEYVYEGCTDYLYTSANEDSTDQEIRDAYLNCLTNHYRTLEGSGDSFFFRCYQLCNQKTEFEVERIELNQGQVCLAESTETTTCKLDSDCYRENLRNNIAMKQLFVNSDNQKCDELFGKKNYSKDELSSTQYSQLVSECYDRLVQNLVVANSGETEEYPPILDTVFDNISECGHYYNLDTRIDDILSTYDNDEDIMNCKTSYCIPEFEKCLNECERQCGGAMECLGDDLDYISYLSNQQCKDYLLENADYYLSFQSVDDNFFAKFEACGDALIQEYSDNNGVSTIVTCQKTCKTETQEPGKPENEENSSQVLKFLIQIVLLAFMI